MANVSFPSLSPQGAEFTSSLLPSESCPAAVELLATLMESSRVRTSCSSQGLCPIWDSKKAAEGSLETSFKITLLKLEKGEMRDWWVSGPFPNLTFYLNKLLEEILVELSQSPAVSPAAPTAVWHSGFPGDEPRRACVQHFVVRALHFNCSKWSGTCLYLIKQHLLSCSISCCNLAKAEATQHLRLELSTYITAQLVDFAYLKKPGFPLWCLMYIT